VHVLPDPFAADDDFVAPRSETERAIARIWQELLGVSRVSLHDNFLDIGGHSLLALRAINRIAKTCGVRLSPSSLNLQTLEQIAAQCGGAGATEVREPADGAIHGTKEAEQPQAEARGRSGRFLNAVKQSIGRS
jgi:hypothetical protein